MTIEVRAVIHFFYLLDTPGEDILARLDSAYGEGVVKVKRLRHWTSKFCNGEKDLDDEARPPTPTKQKCRK
jgi:hypothetical protein